MGFNLGAFASGLAQSGVAGYKTMEDIQSQKKRDELVELQAQQMKTEMQGKEALRSAIANQGGENTFTPNFSGTGGMDTNDVAPTPVQMSASERRSAIEQRAIAGGADPEAAMRYTATRRASDLSNAFDTTMDKLHKESADRMSSIKATAESGGLKGLAETFGPELKKAFGHDIQFKPVPGAAGEIVAMDGKKVVGRYSSLGDATQALEGLVGQEFETKFSKAMLQPGMFGSSKELSDYMLKKQELGYMGEGVDIKRGELGVHKEFYGKGGTYERAAGMRAGAGGDKSLKAKAGEYAEALVDAGAINPATKKPYTAQEAKQYALGVALKDPNAKTKAEWTMSPNGDFRSNAAGVVQDFDPKSNQWKTRGLPQVSANANKVGVIADVSPSGQVGFKGKDGWYSTEQEAVESLSAPSDNSAQPVTTAIPTGSRTELRASADKIDAEIAALRKSVTVKTPSAQRAVVGKQIDDLQAQRSATLKAWAKTPGVAIDSGAAYPMPRP